MVCSFILHSAYHFVLHLEEDHKACSYEYQGYSYDTCALGAVRYSRARSLQLVSTQFDPRCLAMSLPDFSESSYSGASGDTPISMTQTNSAVAQLSQIYKMQLKNPSAQWSEFRLKLIHGLPH